MLAVDGTCEGEMECSVPCRARKATRVPVAVRPMEIGHDGEPHGWRILDKAFDRTYRFRIHNINDLDAIKFVET